MASTYSIEENSFRADKPFQWTSKLIPRRTAGRNYDLHPDGERVAVSKIEEGATEQSSKAVFIFNFFDELRRVAPAKR